MTTTDPDRLVGLLLGTAVGDALGLPAEGLRPATIQRLGWNENWHHHFVVGRGMWSDDTEHTIMLAQALLRSQGKTELFVRTFVWELRWWILGLPAGTELATARSILKLWMGFPPALSGVFSAGNGHRRLTEEKLHTTQPTPCWADAPGSRIAFFFFPPEDAASAGVLPPPCP